MIRIAEIHLDTNGNAHSVRSVLCIIMSSLMPIDIETLFAMRFASQRETDYLNRCSDINKRMFD
jgi:hypothetical protein